VSEVLRRLFPGRSCRRGVVRLACAQPETTCERYDDICRLSWGKEHFLFVCDADSAVRTMSSRSERVALLGSVAVLVVKQPRAGGPAIMSDGS
jgi:hypothetical protein